MTNWFAVHVRTVVINLPGERGDGAEGFVLVQNGRGLSPPLPHVILHRVELRHGPSVGLPRGPFDHVAAVLGPPEGGVTVQNESTVLKSSVNL